ncbi:uncharacterized protein LOC120350010 [Nilaparvata lugens]|uniref:uncharacterized protein LOC120350010 n=1 Tax=Nilaparvata lugens TaxID=108931 RepID=UPI00193D96F0|nr:uncharacterized protein LOC120350010 [Nilaparvata lugens]
MNQRKASYNVRGYSGQTLSQTEFHGDETESSTDDDVDFCPPGKRPKAAPRKSKSKHQKPQVRKTTTRGRRLHSNIQKRQRNESNVPSQSTSSRPNEPSMVVQTIESISENSCGDDSSQQAKFTSNPPIQQHKPIETEQGINADYAGKCLKFLQQSPLEESFPPPAFPGAHLLSDIDEVIAEDLENLRNNGSQSKFWSESCVIEDKPKRSDGVLSVWQNEIGQNVDAQKNVPLDSPGMGKKFLPKYHDNIYSSKTSSDSVGQDHAQRLYPLSTTTSWENESSNQDKPAITDVSNVHPQNQDMSIDIENFNDLVAVSVVQSSEITALKARLSHLENSIQTVQKRMDEFESAMKSYQNLTTTMSSLKTEVLEQPVVDSEQSLVGRQPGIPEQAIILATNPPQNTAWSFVQEETSSYYDLEGSALVATAGSNYVLQNNNHGAPAMFEQQSLGYPIVPNMNDSASISFPGQQQAGSTITSSFQQPQLTYKDSTSALPSGNMKIEVVEAEPEGMELSAASSQSDSITELKNRFDTVMSDFQKLQDKMNYISNSNDNPQGQSRKTSPDPSTKIRMYETRGPLVIDEDYQEPGPSGINSFGHIPNTMSGPEPVVTYVGEKIWGDLTYFEDSKIVGRSFPCRGVHVRIDCFKNREFNKRNNGYHLGPFRNPERSRETTGIRNMIDCGIMLYFIKGELSIVNHAKCTVYVLSNYNFMAGRYGITRDKQKYSIQPDQTLKVLRVPFNKQTNSVLDLKDRLTVDDESFYKVYISFGKNWTERTQNQLPCWLCLQIRTSSEN